jgi:hypothetical protein
VCGGVLRAPVAAHLVEDGAAGNAADLHGSTGFFVEEPELHRLQNGLFGGKIMGFWAKLFGASTVSEALGRSSELPARWGEIEVQGESFRRDAIRRLFEQLGLPSGGVTAATAALRPEPSNQYDKHAVRVEVEGWHIGYVPREISATVAKTVGRGVGSAPVRIWADPSDGVWRARATLFPADAVVAIDYSPAPQVEERLPPQVVQVGAPVDIRHLESVRTRIKGVANYVGYDERGDVGATRYLLIREPDNAHDSAAVVVAGMDGRKLGYVSASRAKVLAACFDLIGADCYLVGGSSISETSRQLWVDLPKADPIRKFAAASS